jgi:hypothetical protein
VRCAHRYALYVIGQWQHRFHGGHAGGDGGPGSAGVLHHEAAHQRTGFQALRVAQISHLVTLAAQADDQHARQVGVAGVAGDGAAKQVEMLTGRGHAATAGLRKGDHAVDLRKGRQPLGREVRGDAVDHRGRAVHRAEQADEVARGHATVGPHITHEAGTLHFGHKVHRHHVQAEAGVAVLVDQREVMAVHVLAGFDVTRGGTDHDVVLAHPLAGGDAPRRDLVAGRYLGLGAQVELGQHLANGKRLAHHQHVVIGVQPDQRGE